MVESIPKNDLMEGSKDINNKSLFVEKINTEKSISSAAVVRRNRLERPTYCVTPRGGRTPLQRSTIMGGLFFIKIYEKKNHKICRNN